MFNQCSFIGKILRIDSSSETAIEVQIELTSINGNASKITIDMPKEIAEEEYFQENHLISVRARVSSQDAKTYRFISERYILLGGTRNES